MGEYIAKVNFRPREIPKFTGKKIAPTVPSGTEILINEDEPAGSKNAWFPLIEAIGESRTGWVRSSWIRPKSFEAFEGQEMTEAERDAFCIAVTRSAKEFQVDRDYLMAVAWTESRGINNIRSASGGAFGPFQFTEGTWKYVTAEFDETSEYTEPMRFDWVHQPPVAALFTRMLEKRLVNALDRKPTLGEIYFSHVFGENGGASLLQEPGDTLFANAYREKIGDPAHVIAGNPFLSNEDGSSRSIGAVLKELSNRLNEGFFGAVSIIDRQRPEVRFLWAQGSHCPWLRVASEEHELGVREIPGHSHDSRIVLYHAVSGGPGSADEVPWCAAFLTFCMRRSGNPQVEQSVTMDNPRLAVSWTGWGVEEHPPFREGSVIVLHPSPSAPRSSGHVGIYMGRDRTNKILLLGGNQSDAINVTAYDESRFRVARWFG